MSLTDLTERLYDLRRDRSSGYEKPYKPVLLLSLIDLIERGDFAENRILLSDELIARYREYVQIVGRSEDTARIEYPFWHLCGDKIWMLYGPDGEPLYRAGQSSSHSLSVRRLRASMEFASFDEELFHHLCLPQDREIVRNALISRYFPEHRALLQELISSFHNQPIAGDDPESYESDPNRSAAFAKTIKLVYDHHCAACGLRIRFRDLTLVDACHLIPFSESFNDHPTNGIALCKNHHWALDRHLIAPDEVSSELVWRSSPLLDDRLEGQRPLVELGSKRLLLPKERKFYPAAESINWRTERLLR